MSAYQRRKGQHGEREFCALASEELGEVFTRRLGQERDSGQDVHIGPFRIDVKRCEQQSLLQWHAEGVAQMKAGEIYVTAWRKNGGPWLMVMGFDDWCTIARGELGSDPLRSCEDLT